MTLIRAFLVLQPPGWSGHQGRAPRDIPGPLPEVPMQQSPQEEKDHPLYRQPHKDPAQEAHLEEAHVQTDAKVVGQVVSDLIVTRVLSAPDPGRIEGK